MNCFRDRIKGLASYMLRYGQAVLKELYPCIGLSVNTDNKALEAYNKAGFAAAKSLINCKYTQNKGDLCLLK